MAEPFLEPTGQPRQTRINMAIRFTNQWVSHFYISIFPLYYQNMEYGKDLR